MMPDNNKIVVLVNGLPVETFIKEEEAKMIEKEANEEFFSVIKEIRKSIPKSRESLKIPFSESCGRPVKLNDNQIRKEYGIMEKPYKTLLENILWVLVNNSPCSLTKISTILNMEGKNLRSTIDRLTAKLPDYISVDKIVLPYQYSILSERNPEEIYKVYQSRIGRKSKSFPQARKTKEGVSQSALKLLTEGVNLKITVEGAIKIFFCFSSE